MTEPHDPELAALSEWLADPARDLSEWRWHGERLGWVRPKPPLHVVHFMPAAASVTNGQRSEESTQVLAYGYALHQMAERDHTAFIARQNDHAPPPTARELTPWLTYAEAAELVRVSPKTIADWVWKGKLRAHKAGARPLIARADLEAMLGGYTAAIGSVPLGDMRQSGPRKATTRRPR